MPFKPIARVCDGCGELRIFKNPRSRFCCKKCWGAQKDPPFEERFWAKVDRTGGPQTCWIWTAALTTNGYGKVLVAGKATETHRASWELNVGPIPEGVFVLHNCPDGDNPACVNPAHLWLGTNAANIADRDAKGRCQKGERHVNARLTETQVLEIRQSSAAGESMAALARRFNVGYMCVYYVVKRKTWKHL